MRKWLVSLVVLVFFVSACESKQERARENLKKLNIAFTPGSFVESAKNSDIVAVESFLEAGMNPDSKNDAGCSAMFYAEMQKNEKIIALLKEHGAKKVNLDRMLGTWELENSSAEITICKKDDQIFWQTTYISVKANLKNDNTLVFPLGSRPIMVEAKLGEDDLLAVSNILNEPIFYKRISK